MSSAAAGTVRAAGLASPNDTVRLAVVGLRGQGRSHIQNYSAMKNVEIVALCDVDESILNTRLKEVEGKSGKRPAAYGDIRKLLEDKSIDAVSIATPNHWHTLQTVWACQAGKDVYCEKPCSHSIFESRQIVAAARRYDRIVQHGSNSRSGPAIREGIQKMREGLIGDVYMARGLCFKWRDTIGRAAEEPAPSGVNYDLWLGPAPNRPYTKNRFHYNWHWFWDYGNGDFGNQGIHELDICRWGLGVTYPKRISAIGGHFMFDDDQETPNTMVVTYDFEEGGKKKLLVFEVRHWISNREAGVCADRKNDPNTVGNVFYGSNGYMAFEWYNKYFTFVGKEQQPGPSRDEPGNNWANFIQALRNRNGAELNAPIEEGAMSCTLMHLGNIAYRLGRTLNFDAATMSFTGDAEANRMLKRQYRAPYEVPEKV